MNPIALSVTAAQETTPAPVPEAGRLASLDAYRGLAMLLMASGLLRLPEVAAHFPDSTLWQALGFHWEHVLWHGWSLHDLIQPSFSFMVGVALPFSMASRLAREQSRAALWIHVLWRALLLVLLGVALRSIGRDMTHWTFEDTLSQIGLGYPSSGGWCFLAMAGFYLLADVWGLKRWFFPLTVVGMNSIAMYVLVESLSGFTTGTLATHFGKGPFQMFGGELAPVLEGAAVMLIFWLVMVWMHRRKLYLRI